uniref:Sleeping Beauty transposase HTH domain-containing protein n=1 Tax=Anabas testudineus TaxID=64144 RepID=A0AAQ6IDY6_ANATE
MIMDTRNKVVDMHQPGKGYKAISKALGLQRTTVRAIIHKWRKLGTVVNLPRSDRPTKITPGVQRRLIQEVIKEPRTTAKELQASLASVNVSVTRRLDKNDINGGDPRMMNQRIWFRCRSLSHLLQQMLIFYL